MSGLFSVGSPVVASTLFLLIILSITTWSIALYKSWKQYQSTRLHREFKQAFWAAREIQIFAEYLERVHFNHMDCVYRQGDKGDRLFFILKGRAKVELLADSSITPFTLSILCPGMMFGEMAIIDDSPRSASIVAEGKLICVSITKTKISCLLTAHPEIAQKLYHGLTLTLLQRLRISDKTISKLRA